MYSLGRLLQVVGLLVTGAGAVMGFDAHVTERTMWLLWGGGGLVFLLGTAIVRRSG